GLLRDANWEQIAAKYRNAANALENDRYASGEVGAFVRYCDGTVARMSALRSQITRHSGDFSQNESLRTEFIRNKRLALDEVENARRTARGRFSLVTEAVDNNWSYLKVLVAAACLLALGVANLF